jgi:putative ATP-binding cassette transporter
MKLPRQLIRIGGRQALAVAVLGLASGFASTGFIALINRIVHGDGVTPRYLLIMLFACLAFARMTTRLWAQWIMVRFAQDKLLGMCEELSKRVVRAPFRNLESTGPARILTTLSDDVTTLSAAIQAIPALAGNAAVLIGCLAYLTYLSWIASLSMLIVTGLGAVCYKLLVKRAYKAISEARAGRDRLFAHFRSLTEGIKEIKMSRDRESLVIEEGIVETAHYLRKQNLVATYDYLKADGWAQIMFYLVIAMLLFGLPAFKEVSVQALTGYALVALYAMAPVWAIIGYTPTFQRGEAALERIDALGISLASDEQVLSQSCKGPVSIEERQPPVTLAAPNIELDSVRFSYQLGDNYQEHFVLGPINLALRPGQVIFLIGGNGSGKTTLVKLITGLYAPDSGEIRVEGKAIPHDCQSYRQLFSVVFSDFYLFDRLPNCGGPDSDVKAKSYLKLLRLDKKVGIQNGVLSTTALSQGQRRRLALLSAYLEDRPIYVFDEWGADQDPAYKDIFYGHLLDELKNRGKTVIVITHDDRYFRFGDVIVKLDSGSVVDCWCAGERAEATRPPGMGSKA